MTMDGKRALVTGAHGGIGRACVDAFLSAGACVVATDIDDDGTQSLSERHRFIRCDLRNENDVESLVAAAAAAFGGLDVVVNNAAMLRPLAAVHETSTEQFEQLMTTNVRAPFLCCKYAYVHLRDSKGCIVNVSSMAGIHGERAHAVYSATKGALNAMTQAMAIDYGRDGIRCNAVCPSSVLTPTTDVIVNEAPDPQRVIEARRDITALGYTAGPKEIASAVLFLASPAASFMTGTLMPVSGGSECGYGVKI
jgi:NAD(P)-dependent dehydrogenase (short-subunit alcohol dehydrogenase family)